MTATQLDLFASAATMPELYTVHGHYRDEDGPVVSYRNVGRREVLSQYARADELAAMVDSGEVRHTSKACLNWRYRIVRQPGPIDNHDQPIPPPWRNIVGTHLWVSEEAT